MTLQQFHNKLNKFLFIKDSLKSNSNKFFEKYDTIIEDAMYNLKEKDSTVQELLSLYFNHPLLQPSEISSKLDVICEKIDKLK